MRMKILFSAALGAVTMTAAAHASQPVRSIADAPLAVVSTAAEATEPALVPESPQVKDDLFSGTEKFAQGAKSVTEVNLDKNMLSMVGKGKNGDDMAAKMDFVVVHTYEYDKPGMYRQEDVDVFRKRLTDGNWNCFVHTREKEESTDVCAKSPDHGETNELVVMSAEAKELTFVHLRGRMSLNEMMKEKGGMRGMMAGAPPPQPPPAPGSQALNPRK